MGNDHKKPLTGIASIEKGQLIQLCSINIKPVFDLKRSLTSEATLYHAKKFLKPLKNSAASV